MTWDSILYGGTVDVLIRERDGDWFSPDSGSFYSDTDITSWKPAKIVVS